MQEGIRKGLDDGRLLEKQAMLQKLLAARGLSEAHRARISACGDAAERDGWIDRAIAGATPVELFESA